MVTVRYFAGASAAAGVDEEVLPLEAGTPLSALISQLAERHGPALERVLAAASFLVDEVATPRSRPVPGGATVDVLPPFAGG